MIFRDFSGFGSPDSLGQDFKGFERPRLAQIEIWKEFKGFSMIFDCPRSRQSFSPIDFSCIFLIFFEFTMFQTSHTRASLPAIFLQFRWKNHGRRKEDVKMCRKPMQTSPEHKKIVFCIILQRFPLVKNDILPFFDDFSWFFRFWEPRLPGSGF